MFSTGVSDEETLVPVSRRNEAPGEVTPACSVAPPSGQTARPLGGRTPLAAARAFPLIRGNFLLWSGGGIEPGERRSPSLDYNSESL